MSDQPAFGLNRPAGGSPAPGCVFVLTAGFGEGHNAAARALGAAFAAAGQPARIVDIFALSTPRLNAIARRTYLRMINHTPRLWNRVYRWMDQATVFSDRVCSMRGPQRRLAALLDSEPCAAICNTFPAYPFMLAKLRRAGRTVPPSYTVVTDSISINSLWWRAPSDGWFLPNEDSAAVMAQAGIEPAKLHVKGFPLLPFFREQEGRLVPPSLAAGAAPRVLHMINSGTRQAEATAEKLLAEEAWEITFAVGRNVPLQRRLTALAAGRSRPAQVFGWTDRIPNLLMTHHAVVSKAGGATTQEAIAARCPMIVNQVVPGQEEGNYELLRRRGVGGLATEPDAVLGLLRRGFADRGALWTRWREALEPLAHTSAAADIAAHVLAAAAEIRAEPMGSRR